MRSINISIKVKAFARMICDRVAQDILARGVTQISEVIVSLITVILLVTWLSFKLFLLELIVKFNLMSQIIKSICLCDFTSRIMRWNNSAFAFYVLTDAA